VTPLSELLQQFSARYHKALITRAALMAGLGSGCCALLAWRLMLLKVQAPASLGVALGLVAALFISLGFWLKHRWMPQKQAAAYLDLHLGLQQRLVTAEEFANTPGRSALYATLVDDLSRQASGKQLKTVRPWNHTSGVLAIALLLLLLWPQLNSVLPPGLRQPELMQQPPKQKVQQDSQQQQQQQSGAGQPQSTNNSGQKDNSQKAGSQQSPFNGSQQGASQQNPQSNPGSAQNPNSQAGSSGSQSSQQSGTGQKQDSPQTAQGSGSQSQANPSSGADQNQGSTPQNNAQQSAQKQNQQGQSGQQSQSGAQQNTQSKQGGQQSGAGQKQNSPEAAQGSGNQGLGQSMGNGAELKADIQKLLKEMSGELKELQGQLDAAKDQPRPQAGSGTDPNLYGAAEKLDPLASKNPMPLQLEADQKTTDKAGRPAGGVAKSSGGISGDLPQTQAQPAQLADQPSEEAASSRQPVPVEYRTVFDQLRRQPSGGKNQ